MDHLQPKPEALEQQERALDCASDMRIKASEYAQMGFKEVARFLRRQADLAMKWAAKQK